ncbi:RNA 3'-terminal phosphate cyclase/enolpyruvate transferase [Amylocarpus encephaloides]|uniref:RNA 3'-terminal phosphate cyclase/enolpyruvate transferase n=1 Tax=Amylocarpus encephaloides TaxID=45428 RepID=A0A9P7YSD4_9HELO|nr:RNA 3'-terminal phosphate cyclase/enolpyruvate transferase [Amylocarpus encephaloides]
MSTSTPEFLKFTTHSFFTQRLVLSTLTGRPIHISQIHSSPTNPGLAPHEISFLRLLDSVTNGSSLQISYTGTTLTYSPGLITGGIAAGVSDVVKCTLPDTCRRGVSWFILPLCMLAPFSKGPVNARFEGEGVITSATESGDVSVDTVRTAVLPLYEKFGIPGAKMEIRVLQRSCAGSGGKGGGGIVEVRFGAQVRLPKTLHMHRRPGRVKKVRGVAYATGVSASNNGRMIHAARSVLNALVSDVHIAAQYDQAPLVPDKTNPSAKKRTGVGFGVCLVAESGVDGVVYSADLAAPSEGGVTPEEIGKKAAWQLLEAIERGGCVSSVGVGTVLLLMAMGSEDVGRIRLGRDVVGSEAAIGLGRDLKKFGASCWGLRDCEGDETGDLIVSVKGVGIGNVGRKIV